jgi:sugar phosphate isomerase/epimerase
MIFVSSSSVKSAKIVESVRVLVHHGFRNIELSGGTDHYPGFEKELLQIKNEYGLNYLLHNYFPPPKEHFVLNLASLDDEVYNKSINHCKAALDLSQVLGAKKYAVHAGFLIDPKVNELGQKIGHQKPYNRQIALERFAKTYQLLKDYAPYVDLYVENNVFSLPNKQSFGFNPFLFTDYRSYMDLGNLVDFNVLLDWAHLKVSCNTLCLSFEDEVNKLAPISNYYHLSDNNGEIDSNKSIDENSYIYHRLKDYLLPKKDITLEVYDGIDAVKKSYRLLNRTYA